MPAQTKEEMKQQLQREQDKDAILLRETLDREKNHKEILDKIGVPESLARGAAEGASFGTAPYVAGAYNKLANGEDFDTAVKRYKQDNANAREANPMSYGGADIAGTVGMTALTGGAAGELGAVGKGLSLFAPGAIRGGADANVENGDSRINQALLHGSIDAATGSLFKYGVKGVSGMLNPLEREAAKDVAPAIANTNIVAGGEDAIHEASPGLALGFKDKYAVDAGKEIWDSGSPLVKKATAGDLGLKGKKVVRDWVSNELETNKPGNFQSAEEKYSYGLRKQKRLSDLNDKLEEMAGDKGSLIQARADGVADKISNPSAADKAIDFVSSMAMKRMPMMAKGGIAAGKGLMAMANNYSNGINVPSYAAASVGSGADTGLKNLFAPANNEYLSNELSGQGQQ